jgi:hypothetical protein
MPFSEYPVQALHTAWGLCGVLIVASRLPAQEPAAPSASDVHAHIATDRTVYERGDSIQVNLRLQNFSSDPVHMWLPAPRDQVRLILRDSVGHSVGADSMPMRQICDNWRCCLFFCTIAIGAGESRTLSWEKREWLNLSDWGLSPEGAGKYTLIGVPAVHGPKLQPDTTLRSNEVTFWITP